MNTIRPIALAATCILAGCASATFGDKSTEAGLKRFEPEPGKVSLYICREDAFNGGGIGTEAFVNGTSLGGLKPNTFAHATAEPGDIKVFLRRNGVAQQSGDSGTLGLRARAGDVVIVWAGPAGFMGPLTVDNFSSDAEARACVRKAAYVVR